MKTVNQIKHVKIKSDLARGLAWTDTGIIHIDTRLSKIEHLDILIHEILHIQNPKWSEMKVRGHAAELAKLIWEQDYQKVDL